MQHVIVLLNALSVLLGALAISFLVFLFFKRRGWILFPLLCTVFLFYVFSLMSIVSIYFETNVSDMSGTFLNVYFACGLVFSILIEAAVLKLYSELFYPSFYKRLLTAALAGQAVLTSVLVADLPRADMLSVSQSGLLAATLVMSIAYAGVVVSFRFHSAKLPGRLEKKLFGLGLFALGLIIGFYMGEYFLFDESRPPGFFQKTHFSFSFSVLSLITIYQSFQYYSQNYSRNDAEIRFISEEFAQKYSLTPRECELVLRAVAGDSNRSIARSFDLTEGSVKVFMSNIYKKVGVNNRVALAQLVRKES